MNTETVGRRKRRSEEERIEELQAKIREVEARKARRRQRTESPIAKDFERLKRQMARFTQACMDSDRADIANSVLAFMTVLERQSLEVREGDVDHDPQDAGDDE